MAIAFDTSNITALDSDKTLSHTCSGSDRILLVYVHDPNQGTLDYNGTSMTQLGSWANNNGLFYLINPDSGAHTITLTTAAASLMRIISASYTGVNQSGFPDSSATASTDSPATVNTTVVATNCWLIGTAASLSLGGGNTYSTNRTDKQSGYTNTTTNNNPIGFSDSNGTVGTGSQSFIFTFNNMVTTTAKELVVSMAPVAIANTSGNMFLVL